MSNWKPIGDRGHQISDLGQVRGLNRLLTPTHGSGGYLRVNLTPRGMQYVHRLVLEAFVGAVPPGRQVNHKNGDKADNRLVNLECVTPGQNNQHAWDSGLVPRFRAKSATCRNGHPRTPGNTGVFTQFDKRYGVQRTGYRCNVCHAAAQRGYVAKKSA